MNIVPLNYKGEIVSFNTDGWINVTGVAERFGKRIDNWMRLAETLEYVRALDEALTGKEFKFYILTIEVCKNQQGTKGQGWWYVATSKTFSCICPLV